MLDCLSKLSDKEISSIIGFVGTVVIPLVIAYKESLWDGLKKLINFILRLLKSLFITFKSRLAMIKSSIHNWLREKIVGKEKIELLEKLDKEDADLLKKLKVLYLPIYNINEHKTYWAYESLITFVMLYNDMIIRNYDNIKKDYENQRIKNGVFDTFEEYTFKTFIKKYSEK